MEAGSIREKLHDYVNSGDEKLLKLMYAVAKEYNEDDDFEYSFTPGDIAEFELRSTKRQSGESKTYNWEDAKNIITGKKQP